jgi:kynureninase
MLDGHLVEIVQAQIDFLSKLRESAPPQLATLLDKSLTPSEVWRAVLKERPVLDQLRRWAIPDPDPHVLRREAASVGLLDVTHLDLEYRRLFPALDLGVYCASHATGKPSLAMPMAIDEHLSEGAVYGAGAWLEGGWLEVIDAFREAVTALVGGNLGRGDVLWYPNFSESLAALLPTLRGRLVTTAGHFTSAHYIHEVWAERGGGEVHVVPMDESGCVPTERLVEALDERTTVVSLSHALYRTGYLHDLDAIAVAMAERCPEAVLLLDAYQTLGTVPVDLQRLPSRTAVLSGGVKQLHAGTGAGFAWISNPLLDLVEPDRVGWWGHRDPLAFDHGPFDLGEGAVKLRTGTPALVPMVALVTELGVLATSGNGDLQAAVRRARERTRAHMAAGLETAEAAGLEVRGGTDPERRGAFLALWVPDGETVVTALAEEGVFVDFRADAPESDGGLIRVGSNAAGFGYEVVYAVERIAAYAADR